MSKKVIIPGIGIAGVIIKDNKVLLGKRKNSFSHGTWQFPEGTLRPFETFEKAVRREIKEECSLEIENIRFFGITNNIIKEERRHFVTIFMGCEYVSGKPKPLEPDHCESWEWFEWDNLPKPLFKSVENFLKNQLNLNV